MQNDLQNALIKYNKKTWCKSALLGFSVGIALVVISLLAYNKAKNTLILYV